MKKPIKEVMEKASKGPFDEAEKARGLLTDHCLNNFGPLLEAFERFIASVADEGGFNGSFADADEAIKAASEVEVE